MAWTCKDVRILEQNYKDLSDKALEELILEKTGHRHTAHAICDYRIQHGLRKFHVRGTEYRDKICKLERVERMLVELYQEQKPGSQMERRLHAILEKINMGKYNQSTRNRIDRHGQ